MTEHNILIKYNIDQIFECQEHNRCIPKALIPYCSNTDLYTQKNVLNELLKTMDEVTKSYSRGINPNDIVLKQKIRECLNRLSVKNYDDILSELTALKYTDEHHFVLLVEELITKSMNDAMSSKSIDPKVGQKTLSELYMNIAKELSSFATSKDGQTYQFKTILNNECRKWFNRLTDKSERLDYNNPSNVNNYKGLMNMFGLMYTLNLFPSTNIKVCLNRILDRIIEPNDLIKEDERDNYYLGAERLIHRIFSYYQNHYDNQTITENISIGFKQMAMFINEFNERLDNACKNTEQKPIKRYSEMVQKQKIEQFNTLVRAYEAF